MLQKKGLVLTVLKLLKRMVNTLGVDSDEWFEDRPPNPLDSMPIANGKNRYHPNPDFEPEPPRPEEEIADWFNNTEIENPDESDEIEEEKTMHQKMYEIATAKYNPFAIGGSDNFQGGSENLTES